MLKGGGGAVTNPVSQELLIKIEEKERRISHLEKEFAMAQGLIGCLESLYNMAWNRVETMEKAVREFESTLLTPTCCVHCALERVKEQCDDSPRNREREGDCSLCLEWIGSEHRDDRGSMVPTVEAGCVELEAIKPAALLASLELLLDSRFTRMHEPQQPIFTMDSPSYRFPPPSHEPTPENLSPMASPSYRFPLPASEPTSEDNSLIASFSYTFPEPSSETEPASNDRCEAASAHTSPTSSVSMSLPPLELSIAEKCLITKSPWCSTIV